MLLGIELVELVELSINIPLVARLFQGKLSSKTPLLPNCSIEHIFDGR